MQAEPSEIAEDNRAPLAVPRRLKTVVAQFLDSHQDAVELMAVLSLSHHLEEVNFRFCHNIPAAAWQQLRGATWRNLKKAGFKSCLAKRNGWKVFSFFYSVYSTVCSIYLSWKVFEFRVNVVCFGSYCMS